jgi:hypothetical protein
VITVIYCIPVDVSSLMINKAPYWKPRVFTSKLVNSLCCAAQLMTKGIHPADSAESWNRVHFFKNMHRIHMRNITRSEFECYHAGKLSEPLKGVTG